MHLTHKYRLMPSKQARDRLGSLLEGQRQLYNAALQERMECHAKTGRSVTLYDQQKSLTVCRRQDPNMAAVPANLQRGTLRRLDNAFKGFFRRCRRGEKPGFPRFRGRGWFDTLEFVEYSGIRFDGRRIHSKAFGSIRVHLHRSLPDEHEIKAVKLTKDFRGQWAVCFSLKVPDVPKRPIRTAVGVDVGLADLATLSTGETIPNLRAALRAERKLRVAQRAKSRKTKGSNGRRKAVEAEARVHRKIKNVRNTHNHQVSARLVKEFDFIGVEDLKIRNMVKNRRLAKHINDASWGDFLRKTEYKAERAGATFGKCDPKFTSQDCSGCGARVWKALSKRWHSCPECGTELARDHNSAILIRDRSYRAVVGPEALKLDVSWVAPGNVRLAA